MNLIKNNHTLSTTLGTNMEQVILNVNPLGNNLFGENVKNNKKRNFAAGFYQKRLFSTRFSVSPVSLPSGKKHAFLRVVGIFFRKEKNRKTRKILRLLNNIKKKIETFSSYSYSDFQDSFAVGTLLLIIIKISLYLIIGIRISPIKNILLLLIMSGISLKYNIILLLREKLYKTMKIIVGRWYLGHESGESWRDLKTLAPDIKIPADYWYNKIGRAFLVILLYLRLWIYAETYLYIILRYLLGIMLIFNKLLLVTYILSLISIISRFIFLLIDKTYSNFKRKLNYFEEGIVIMDPKWENAKILLLWMTFNFQKKDLKDNFLEDPLLSSSQLAYFLCRMEDFDINFIPPWSEENTINYHYLNKIINKFIFFSIIFCFFYLFYFFFTPGEENNYQILMLTLGGGWKRIKKENTNFLVECFPNIPRSVIAHDSLYHVQKITHFGHVILEFTNTTTLKSSCNFPNLLTRQLYLNLPYGIVQSSTQYQFTRVFFENQIKNVSEDITPELNENLNLSVLVPKQGNFINYLCGQDSGFKTLLSKTFVDSMYAKRAPAIEIPISLYPYHFPLISARTESFDMKLLQHYNSTRLFELLSKRSDLSNKERAFYSEKYLRNLEWTEHAKEMEIIFNKFFFEDFFKPTSLILPAQDLEPLFQDLEVSKINTKYIFLKHGFDLDKKSVSKNFYKEKNSQNYSEIKPQADKKKILGIDFNDFK